MEYNKFFLTEAGADLLSRVHTGSSIKFTRAAIGSGTCETMEELRTSKKLTEERLSAPVIAVQNQKNGTCKIKVVFENKGLETGFMVNEVGVFAEDPTKGEILYFVCATNGETGFFPANPIETTSTGSEVYNKPFVEMPMEIYVVIGDAEEVNISMSSSMTFAMKEDLDDLAGIGRTTETVKKNADDILALMVEVAALKGAALNNINSNIFMVNLKKLTAEEMFAGYWNVAVGRLEV